MDSLPDVHLVPDSSKRIIAAAINAGLQVEAAARAVMQAMRSYHSHQPMEREPPPSPLPGEHGPAVMTSPSDAIGSEQNVVVV